MSKKLNILLINRWVGYNEGGNETHMKDLIEWFTKQGHHVTVMTTEGAALEKFRSSIDAHWINTPKGYYSYGYLGLFYGLLFNIKCLIKFTGMYARGNRFDVVSVHFSLEAYLARFIKLLFGVPYVMVLAGDTPLELIEAKRADGKIQISHFMNEQCKKYGYEAEIIPKGLDLSRFKQSLSTDELKKKLGLSKKKIVLTVCRLDPRKNIITLIRAADILVHQNGQENLHFIVVGDGIEREYLERNVKRLKLQNHINFVGAIPNTSDLLPQYYAMANLFVLPTLYEGFGWVFLEAMASGVPIITTRVGSNPEVVGDVGALIEPKSPIKLAEKIAEIFRDKEQINAMRQRGLIKADRFAWPKIITKYEKYYAEVCETKNDSLNEKLCTLYFLIIDTVSQLRRIVTDRVFFNPVTKNVSEWIGSGQAGTSSQSDKKLNILFFHRWTGVRGGGTETHVKGLIEFFSKKHTTYLLTRSGKHLINLKKTYPSLITYTVTKNLFENDNSYEFKPLLYLHTLIFMMKSTIFLVWFIGIRRTKIDIISVHFATEAIVARFIRFVFRIPYIFIIEGYTDWEAREAKLANGAISISHYISNRCKSNFGYYPPVLRIGESKFSLITESEFNKKLKTNSNLALTVCRLEPRKNIETLLRAIQYIVHTKKRKDIHFSIAGTGILEQKLKQMINDYKIQTAVAMLGFVSDKDLLKLYRTADVYIHPAFEEGFGIVYIEAMKSGCAIISSNTSAIPEVVEQAGVLTKNPEDFKELAIKILKLFDDKALRKTYAKHARSQSEKYDWNDLIKQYEKIYRLAAYRS